MFYKSIKLKGLVLFNSNMAIEYPKLITISKEFRGRVFELTKKQYSCGRNPQNDISIEDSAISAFHCEFVLDGQTYKVIDKNSTNGTRVNNIDIKEKKLRHNDIIQLGKIELIYDFKSEKSEIDPNLRTKTGIVIMEDSTEIPLQEMKNFSPFANNRNRIRRFQKIITMVIIFLALLVISLLILLFVGF